MSQPTVVSAYYPIPSKTTVHKYVEWIFSFWPKTKCPLVFFTDPLIQPQFEAMFKERPGPTKVIGIPFQNLVGFTKLSPRAWIFTHQFDPEKIHSPELYAIWYEKKEFVLRAIQENPFGSDHFVWCDAGIGRYPDWIPHLERFPMREAMPPANKMLVLRIKAFTRFSSENPAASIIRRDLDSRPNMPAQAPITDVLTFAKLVLMPYVMNPLRDAGAGLTANSSLPSNCCRCTSGW
jgi:hypothetical protein